MDDNKHNSHEQYVRAIECLEHGNTTEAVTLLSNAAAQHHADAQNELGVCYIRGLVSSFADAEVHKSPFRARECGLSWCLKAAQQGNVFGQFNVALLYRGCPTAASITDAATEKKVIAYKAARAGAAAARRLLVKKSSFARDSGAKGIGDASGGDGNDADSSSSSSTVTCSVSDFASFNQFGAINPTTMPPSSSPAPAPAFSSPPPPFSSSPFSSFRSQPRAGSPSLEAIAAAINDTITCADVAALKQVPPDDLAVSFAWYMRAAALGHRQAQTAVGYCFLHGSGATKDASQAVRWFRRAAYPVYRGVGASLSRVASCMSAATAPILCRRDTDCDFLMRHPTALQLIYLLHAIDTIIVAPLAEFSRASLILVVTNTLASALSAVSSEQNVATCKQAPTARGDCGDRKKQERQEEEEETKEELCKEQQLSQETINRKSGFPKAAAQTESDKDEEQDKNEEEEEEEEIDNKVSGDDDADAHSIHAKGEPLAQYELAMCYKHGIGVPKDAEAAFDWFNFASTQGHADSIAQASAMLMKRSSGGNPNSQDGDNDEDAGKQEEEEDGNDDSSGNGGSEFNAEITQKWRLRRRIRNDLCPASRIAPLLTPHHDKKTTTTTIDGTRAEERRDEEKEAELHYHVNDAYGVNGHDDEALFLSHRQMLALTNGSPRFTAVFSADPSLDSKRQQSSNFRHLSSSPPLPASSANSIASLSSSSAKSTAHSSQNASVSATLRAFAWRCASAFAGDAATQHLVGCLLSTGMQVERWQSAPNVWHETGEEGKEDEEAQKETQPQQRHKVPSSLTGASLRSGGHNSEKKSRYTKKQVNSKTKAKTNKAKSHKKTKRTKKQHTESQQAKSDHNSRNPCVDTAATMASVTTTTTTTQNSTSTNTLLFVAADMGSALLWYLRASAQGYAPAQTEVATAYCRGIGVRAQNIARAATWYREAALAGYARAQWMYGNMCMRNTFGEGLTLKDAHGIPSLPEESQSKSSSSSSSASSVSVSATSSPTMVPSTTHVMDVTRLTWSAIIRATLDVSIPNSSHVLFPSSALESFCDKEDSKQSATTLRAHNDDNKNKTRDSTRPTPATTPATATQALATTTAAVASVAVTVTLSSATSSTCNSNTDDVGNNKNATEAAPPGVAIPPSLASSTSLTSLASASTSSPPTSVGQSATRAALRWFMHAAQQQFAKAFCSVGLCYRNGIGANRNDALALHWFRCGALANHAPSQYYLALCYMEGAGVVASSFFARVWLLRAAFSGCARAQNELGVCFEARLLDVDGAGGSRDADAESRDERQQQQAAETTIFPLASMMPVGLLSRLTDLHDVSVAASVQTKQHAADSFSDKNKNDGGDNNGSSGSRSKSQISSATHADNNVDNSDNNDEKKKKTPKKVHDANNCNYYVDSATDIADAHDANNDANDDDDDAKREADMRRKRKQRRFESAYYWYSLAAAGGSTAAQYNLGRCLWFGIGVRRSIPAARTWFAEAAHAWGKLDSWGSNGNNTIGGGSNTDNNHYILENLLLAALADTSAAERSVGIRPTNASFYSFSSPSSSSSAQSSGPSSSNDTKSQFSDQVSPQARKENAGCAYFAAGEAHMSCALAFSAALMLAESRLLVRCEHISTTVKRYDGASFFATPSSSSSSSSSPPPPPPSSQLPPVSSSSPYFFDSLLSPTSSQAPALSSVPSPSTSSSASSLLPSLSSAPPSVPFSSTASSPISSLCDENANAVKRNSQKSGTDTTTDMKQCSVSGDLLPSSSEPTSLRDQEKENKKKKQNKKKKNRKKQKQRQRKHHDGVNLFTEGTSQNVQEQEQDAAQTTGKKCCPTCANTAIVALELAFREQSRMRRCRCGDPIDNIYTFVDHVRDVPSYHCCDVSLRFMLGETRYAYLCDLQLQEANQLRTLKKERDAREKEEKDVQYGVRRQQCTATEECLKPQTGGCANTRNKKGEKKEQKSKATITPKTKTKTNNSSTTATSCVDEIAVQLMAETLSLMPTLVPETEAEALATTTLTAALVTSAEITYKQTKLEMLVENAARAVDYHTKQATIFYTRALYHEHVTATYRLACLAVRNREEQRKRSGRRVPHLDDTLMSASSPSRLSPASSSPPLPPPLPTSSIVSSPVVSARHDDVALGVAAAATATTSSSGIADEKNSNNDNSDEFLGSDEQWLRLILRAAARGSLDARYILGVYYEERALAGYLNLPDQPNLDLYQQEQSNVVAADLSLGGATTTTTTTTSTRMSKQTITPGKKEYKPPHHTTCDNNAGNYAGSDRDGDSTDDTRLRTATGSIIDSTTPLATTALVERCTPQHIWTNARLATYWYRRAATEGHAESCYRLSKTLLADQYDCLSSTQTSRARVIGRQWLLRAARAGHKAAQLTLGRVLLYGDKQVLASLLPNKRNDVSTTAKTTAAAEKGQEATCSPAVEIDSKDDKEGDGVFLDTDRGEHLAITWFRYVANARTSIATGFLEDAWAAHRTQKRNSSHCGSSNNTGSSIGNSTDNNNNDEIRGARGQHTNDGTNSNNNNKEIKETKLLRQTVGEPVKNGVSTSSVTPIDSIVTPSPMCAGLYSQMPFLLSEEEEIAFRKRTLTLITGNADNEHNDDGANNSNENEKKNGNASNSDSIFGANDDDNDDWHINMNAAICSMPRWFELSRAPPSLSSITSLPTTKNCITSDEDCISTFVANAALGPVPPTPYTLAGMFPPSAFPALVSNPASVSSFVTKIRKTSQRERANSVAAHFHLAECYRRGIGGATVSHVRALAGYSYAARVGHHVRAAVEAARLCELLTRYSDAFAWCRFAARLFAYRQHKVPVSASTRAGRTRRTGVTYSERDVSISCTCQDQRDGVAPKGPSDSAESLVSQKSQKHRQKPRKSQQVPKSSPTLQMQQTQQTQQTHTLLSSSYDCTFHYLEYATYAALSSYYAQGIGTRKSITLSLFWQDYADRTIFTRNTHYKPRIVGASAEDVAPALEAKTSLDSQVAPATEHGDSGNSVTPTLTSFESVAFDLVFDLSNRFACL